MDWIHVYLGIRHLEDKDTSLFRSFPGSVREQLADSNMPQGEGRNYDAGSRPWFLAAEETRLKAADLGPKAQLQAFRPTISLTAPYKDADGKGDVVSLAAPVARHGAQFVGVVGIDLVVASLRDVIKKVSFTGCRYYVSVRILMQGLAGRSKPENQARRSSSTGRRARF